MVEISLRKQQKADLARSINSRQLNFADFTLKHGVSRAFPDGAYTVSHKDLKDRFIIYKYTDSADTSYFKTIMSPGSIDDYDQGTHASWSSVLLAFESWLDNIQSELTAEDPWESAEEQMENDESNFSLDEFPKIDSAIEVSLEELKAIGLKNGKKLKEIEASVEEAKDNLKVLARKVNKSEWLGIFKSVGVGLLAEWGVSTEQFRSVLETLLTSATDVVQLAEHASKYFIQ